MKSNPSSIRSDKASALHSAERLGFARHHAGDAPIVNQDVGLGDPLPPRRVANAAHAALKKGMEAVLVRSIQQDGDGGYIGEIYGFEPHHGTQFEGLKLGDRIAFGEEHVFTCGD